MKNKVQAPYVKSSARRWYTTGNPTASSSINPYEQTLREDVGLLGLALQSNSSDYPVLILHRQLGKWSWVELWTKTFHKTLHRS